MTTPTPPDAVREAAKNVVLAFHDWPNHTSTFADGERRNALNTLADALLTRPSDARGREVVEYGVLYPKGGMYHHGPVTREAAELTLAAYPRKNLRIVQRTVTTTEWTPLSPTQEGANNG